MMAQNVLQPDDMRRDATLNLRVPQELKDALIHAASEDLGRTTSGMAAFILGEWLRAKGYLRLPAAPAGKSRRGMR